MLQTRRNSTGLRAALASTMAAAGLLVGATGAAAQEAPNLADVQIVEGQGVGDIVVLDQTRSELVSTLGTFGVDAGGCATESACTFRLSPDTGQITVDFDAADTIDEISINFAGVSYGDRWETTAGVQDGIDPFYVQLIYPDALTYTEPGLTQIVANNEGYAYNYAYTCYNESCAVTTTHDVFEPGTRGPVNPEVTAEFVGDISVTNSGRKGDTFNVVLSITQPDGSVFNYSQRSFVAGGETLTFDPATFVSVNGDLGTYTYSIELQNLKGKGRTVAANSGSFQLVAV